MTTLNQDIIQQNLDFVYGRKKDDAIQDPDKHVLVKAQPRLDNPNIIDKFVNEYAFLAPDFPCTVFYKWNELPFPSYEHALLASKYTNQDIINAIRSSKDIRTAKSYVTQQGSIAREAEVPMWKEKCVPIAEHLLRDKFIRNKELTIKLMKIPAEKTIHYLNDISD